MLVLATLMLAILAGGQAWCGAGIRGRLLGRIDVVEALFLRVATGFLLTTAWGIALVWADVFDWRALAALPAAAFFLWLPGALFGERARRAPGIDPLALGTVVALIAIGAIAYWPPIDVRLEARDPGVYYLAGVQLAETGSLDWRDPLVEEMSPAARVYFFPAPERHTINASQRFIGFYLEERDTARVIPQTLPVLPIWVAVGHTAFGSTGGLAANGVLAILATISVFFLSRRMLGRWPAAAAALALGASWLQAWFARYGAAEIPAQALLAIGLYGLMMFRRHRDAGFGAMAALGIGLALFTKAELVLVLGPLGVLLLADAGAGRLRGRDWGALWLPLAGVVIATWVYARLELWPYYYDLLQQAGLRPLTFVLLAAVGGGGLAVAALLLSRVPAGARRGADRLLRGDGAAARRLGALAALALTLGAVWAWVIRPVVWEAQWDMGGGFAGSWDAYNLVQLAWAISPVAMVLAIAGCAVLVADRGGLRRGAGAVCWIALALTVALLFRRQIQPLLPWAYRRWLPLVIPMLWIAAAWSVAWVGIRIGVLVGRRTPIARIAAPVLAIALATPIVLHQYRLASTYHQVDEMPGVVAVLEEIRAVTEPGSLLLFEPRSSRGLPRFEAVLHIEGDRSVLRLPRGEVDTAHVRDLVLRSTRRDVPVYLVTTGFLNGLAAPAAERMHELRWRTRRIREEETAARYAAGVPLRGPLEYEEMLFRGRVYRLRPGGAITPLDGTLDVGGWDDLYLLGEDMHETEVDASGRTFRWTEGHGGVLLPGLGPDADRIELVADPDTPESVPAQRMRVSLDGVTLGTVDLAEGWRTYEFAIPDSWTPPAGGAPPRLSLDIEPSFRLRDVVPGSEDIRYLGVKIDRVSWSGSRATPPPLR